MIGHGLSSIGTRMQEAAVLWHLYELSDSPWSLGADGCKALSMGAYGPRGKKETKNKVNDPQMGKNGTFCEAS